MVKMSACLSATPSSTPTRTSDEPQAAASNPVAKISCTFEVHPGLYKIRQWLFLSLGLLMMLFFMFFYCIYFLVNMLPAKRVLIKVPYSFTIHYLRQATPMHLTLFNFNSHVPGHGKIVSWNL